MTKRPELIVDPAFVEAGLDAGTIRVIDCTVTFETKPVGASTIHSGRAGWRAHSGRSFLHMVDDLSDPEGAYPSPSGCRRRSTGCCRDRDQP